MHGILLEKQKFLSKPSFFGHQPVPGAFDSKMLGDCVLSLAGFLSSCKFAVVPVDMSPFSQPIALYENWTFVR
jgi:hypothetical protein